MQSRKIVNLNFLNVFSKIRSLRPHSVHRPNVRNFAKPASGGIPSLGSKKKAVAKGPVMQKKELPVESNPEILVNYACGTDFEVEGKPVPLKPDSEYPEWLWELRTTKPPPIEELDPESAEYWERLCLEKKRRNCRLMKAKWF